MMNHNVIIKEISYPKYSQPIVPEPPSVMELLSRLDKCRLAMKQRGLSHLIVYGDREHFANLMYLVHFDPRFEEALLIINVNNINPIILVGNEGEGHLGVSPLWKSGNLRHERYQPFSLMNQPRNETKDLKTIFEQEKISSDSLVGLVGWKYYNEKEFVDYKLVSDIPYYIVDTLNFLLPNNSLFNATDILINPTNGLRCFLSPYEIAVFEYSNILGSEAMYKILKNFKENVPDYEIMKKGEYNGYPLSCHMSVKSAGNQHYGLSSPTGDLILKGHPCSISIAYWGSNICRAGWVAENSNDLPINATDYINNYVASYFNTLRLWLSNLKIGTSGAILYNLISENLPFDKYHIYLNPGHLIHFDEWISSPIYKDSTEIIKSGMYIQSDIIPRSPIYSSSRMEEGYVIADSDLQEELKDKYYDVYIRCMERREFMKSLGFELPKEVLPLSNLAGIVSPFFLNYKSILSFK